MSGFVGAVIGAIANAWLRELSERRGSREQLVGEIAIFTQECLSSLLEFYHATCLGAEHLEKWAKLAALERLVGRGMALEVRIFREFRGRKIRVAFRKILDRVRSVKDAVSQSDPLPEPQFKIALGWIDEQRAMTGALISAAHEAGFAEIRPVVELRGRCGACS